MAQGQPAALATHGLGATGKEGFFTTRNARGAQTSDSMAHAQSAARREMNGMLDPAAARPAVYQSRHHCRWSKPDPWTPAGMPLFHDSPQLIGSPGLLG
ncbi:hypothetical protein D3C85_660350 [compost metagenome]